MTAKGTILTLVLAQAGFVPDCGQPPSEGSVISEDKDEPTAESMEESTSAEGSELQGMVDSYAVAHEKIEEEGGEKETSPYHVGYIVEPVEGWWEGDPEDPEWRDPSPTRRTTWRYYPSTPRAGS